jgi:hypothetical protein
MRKKQRGVSALSTVFTVAVLGGLLLGLFKLIPVYTEYFEVKHTLTDIAQNQQLSELDARKKFQLMAAVAGIDSIKAENLIVVAGSNILFLRAKYRREVPLVANVSLAFDFDTSAGQNPAAQP